MLRRPRPPLADMRSHLALAFLVAHFSLAPMLLAPLSGQSSQAARVVHLILLGFAVLSLTERWAPSVVCVSLVAAGIVIGAVGGQDRADVGLAEHSASALAIGIAWFVGTARFVREDLIDPALISRAVSMYMLAGVFWAESYQAIQAAAPGAFVCAQGEVDPRGLHYFSYVTMTTLGYGDITPVSQIAKSLAVLQSVFGQMFVAIVIGRLVGLQVSQARSTALHAPAAMSRARMSGSSPEHGETDG